jgi:CRP-like cAMP-binding protein
MGNRDIALRLIRSVPLFSGLTDENLGEILESPANGFVECPPLTDIVKENEIGDCMYVILDGTVDVRITGVSGQEITVATLKAGEFFGEQALLPGSSGRRNATVSSLTRTRLFKISKQDVITSIRNDPVFETDPVDYENASAEDRVRLMMRGIRLFRSLKEEDLATIFEWTEVQEYQAGESIILREQVGDYMYVILDGRVEVFVTDSHNDEFTLAYLTKGHYFGEQALLPQGSGRRNASVRAATAVTLVKVAREYFRLILNRDKKLELALQRIGETERRKIAEALRQRRPG